MLPNTDTLIGSCGASEMSLQILSVLCNIVHHRKVFPVGAQLRYDVRLVLILIATNDHQAIVYSAWGIEWRAEEQGEVGENVHLRNRVIKF